MTEKLEDNLKTSGFIYAGLFGLNYNVTIRVINKLLRPYGLKLYVHKNYKVYGDASFVKIVKKEI